MDRSRPWQTDAEIEESQRARYRVGSGAGPAPFKPEATYGLLAAFGAVFVLEFVILNFFGPGMFLDVFTIQAKEVWYDWITRPWSPMTATLSHSTGRLMHIFFNGLALYFFGPTLEQILGLRRYLVFFVSTGAISSMVQASIVPFPALGASGAIMALIGMTIILNPRAKIILFPFPVPIPLWIAGMGFAALDLLGVIGGASGIGNLAHLSGLAIGLAYGWKYKQDLAARGLRLVIR